MKKRIYPPRLGAANNASYYEQAAGAVPPERLQNFRMYVPDKDRPVGGVRPGITKYSARRVGNGGPGQGMGTIRRARTPIGWQRGSANAIESGFSRRVTALTGNFWGLRANLGMFADISETLAWTGQTTPDATALAVSPDGTMLAVVTNFTNVDKQASLTVYSLTGFNSDGLPTLLWKHLIAETGIDRFANCVCWTSGGWLMVGTNKYVEAHYHDSTHDLAVSFDLNGWSDEVTAIAERADGTLLVGFNGKQLGVTLLSGVVVTTGKYGRQWRSGVMCCTVRSVATALLSGPPILHQTPLSTQLVFTDRYFDGDLANHIPHNYCRLSEKLPRSPRGGLITGICTTADGGFAVVHSNSGWGPNGVIANPDYFPPDTTVAAPSVVSLFDSSGELVFTADTYSLQLLDDDGFLNDLPSMSNPTTTLLAVIADSTGRIFVAGQANAAGITNGAFDAGGSALWSRGLGGTLSRGGLALASDGSVIAAGERNSAWDGVHNAHLWKMRPDDGSVTAYFDLNAAVDGEAVAVSSKGDVLYGTTWLT